MRLSDPAQFKGVFDDVEPVEVTPQVIHEAAAGMTQLLWRNTIVVEDRMHAGSGPWSDQDMLRNNTRVTQLIREALEDVVGDRPTGEERFEDLMRDICDLLPTEALKDALWDETSRKATFWGAALEVIEPGIVLTKFINGHGYHFMSANRDWWGHPAYPARISWLATLNPPDPDTFADRALACPWTLTDAQARFIIDRRYDGPR